MIVFTVKGVPKAQPRAKAVRRGLFIRMYDPGSAHEWKKLVREAAEKAWQSHGKEVFWRPVSIVMSFAMPRPKGHYRACGDVKSNSPRFASTKPDADNLAKAVMDALTTLGVWNDDAQVVMLSVEKLYAATESEVGMWCKIENAPEIPFPKLIEKAQ